jgi:predicted O-methyltransferase YrrM
MAEDCHQTQIQRLTSFFFALVDITKVLAHNPKQTKHILKWARALFYQNRPLKYGLPWLTYDAILWLESHLTKKMVVFEWGSGGSTVYFAQKVKQLISVEHDKKWYEQTKKTLEERLLKNKVKYLYKPPKKIGKKGKKVFLSSQPKYSGYSFAQYCQIINKFPDSSFDLVLVDDEARNDCLRLAKKKVRQAGYLILDNSDTPECKTEMQKMKRWPRTDFPGIGPFNSYLWQTTIWQKALSPTLV